MGFSTRVLSRLSSSTSLSATQQQLMRFDREDYALRPGSDVGVFMCGPDTVASSLRTGAQHAMLTSFMNAPANGEDQMTSFFFTKEHF